MDEPESKNVLRRTTENQLAVRGSKKAANLIAAYGAYLQTRPDSTIVRRQYSGHFRRDGSAIVKPHEVKVTEFTTSEKGKNFKQTDGSSKGRISMGRKVVFAGRLVPVLGYGYVIHNTLSGEVDPGNPTREDVMGRTYQGASLLAARSVVSHYSTGGTTINLLTAGKFL